MALISFAISFLCFGNQGYLRIQIGTPGHDTVVGSQQKRSLTVHEAYARRIQEGAQQKKVARQGVEGKELSLVGMTGRPLPCCQAATTTCGRVAVSSISLLKLLPI